MQMHGQEAYGGDMRHSSSLGSDKVTTHRVRNKRPSIMMRYLVESHGAKEKEGVWVIYC